LEERCGTSFSLCESLVGVAGCETTRLEADEVREAFCGVKEPEDDRTDSSSAASDGLLEADQNSWPV
jgi:hypothetical protein